MRVSGNVVRDTTRRPVARITVVLHAMSREGGGPVDSTRTDASGHYTFRVSRVDPTAPYVVSALYAGIAHFSEPVFLAGRDTANFGPLAVYDTSSSGPPIHMALRYLSITSAREDGTHEVIEGIELLNPGNRTRVTPTTGDVPVWQGALPAGVVQWQVGESDFSADAVSQRGDSVAVFAPLSPGATKQLAFAYVTPRTMRELRLPIDQPVSELLILLEDTLATVTGPGMTNLAVNEIEGRRYARYRSTAPASGTVVIALLQPRFRAEKLVPWVVGAAAIALGLGLVISLRKPRVSR